jgi:elongation factor P hydroxylase
LEWIRKQVAMSQFEIPAENLFGKVEEDTKQFNECVQCNG